MMKFYIFRHGETDWNKEKRIQGHTNIKLNEKGEIQAKELGKILTDLNLDIVYSSDLERAYKTAIIATTGLGIEVLKDSRLREAHFGDAEGMILSEIHETFGEDLWSKFTKMGPQYLDSSFPGGESRRDSIKRMKSVINQIIEEGKYRRIGISTHGGVVRNLLGSYIMENGERESFDIPIPNCVVYELEYNYRKNSFRIRGPIN